MTKRKETIVRLNQTGFRWYADEKHVSVFRGADYGYRCVAVMGPARGNRFLLLVTANPKFMLWKMRAKHGDDVIVHACYWSKARSSEDVMDQLNALIAQTGIEKDGPWWTFPRKLVERMVKRAAFEADITILDHPTFAKLVRDAETKKLRERMLADGVAPDKVARVRCV